MEIFFERKIEMNIIQQIIPYIVLKIKIINFSIKRTGIKEKKGL